jgi:hypothetical protein
MKLRVIVALLLVAVGAKDGWAWAPQATNGSAASRLRSCPNSVLAFVPMPEAPAEFADLGREL